MSELAALFDGPRDGPLTVLTAVAAPSVEAELVAGFAEPGLEIRVVRRCVDLVELMAAAAVGTARAALISADLRGLDREALAQLAASGIAVVGLAADEAGERLLHQLGAGFVVGAAAPPAQVAGALHAAAAAGPQLLAAGGSGAASSLGPAPLRVTRRGGRPGSRPRRLGPGGGTRAHHRRARPGRRVRRSGACGPCSSTPIPTAAASRRSPACSTRLPESWLPAAPPMPAGSTSRGSPSAAARSAVTCACSPA